MDYLDLPDLRIACRREGKGSALVLLHGWPEWSAVWRRNLPVLAERFEVIAPDLRNFGDRVGASRATCRAYFRHFLSHWARHPAAFDAELEEWVENFSKPGRLAGGVRWYTVASARRLRAMEEAGGETRERIDVPAYSLWGFSDPILRAEWSETLAEIFSDIRVELAEEAGHFVHWEQPVLAN